MVQETYRNVYGDSFQIMYGLETGTNMGGASPQGYG